MRQLLVLGVVVAAVLCSIGFEHESHPLIPVHAQTCSALVPNPITGRLDCVNSGSGTGTVTSITLSGTTGQITLTGATCTSTTTVTCTFSIPSAFVLPGTINGLTITTSTGTLTIAAGKTATVSNTLIFSGTDGSTVAFGAGGTILYTGAACGGDLASTFPNCTVASVVNAAKPTTGNVAAYDFNNITTILHDLVFTDATYDIGKSGATRPRDVFASRNGTFGGTLTGGAIASNGSTAGLVYCTANASAATIPANSFGITCPATITTSWVMEPPNSNPTANQLMSFPAPTSNVSQWAWITPGGTCTNQAVTAVSAVLVPTCTTITSAYVNNSIALTGTDINTSNQVTVTHLAAALPAAQGGTSITSLGTGVATALGQNVSGSGAICLTSGSACASGGGGTGSSVVNVTPVTVAANTTSDQSLMEVSLNAGYLNTASASFKLFGGGNLTIGVAQTPTLTFKAKLCTVSGCGSGTVVTLVTITSAASIAATNNGWNLFLEAATSTTGATGNLIVKGAASLDIGALPGSTVTAYNDTNTAVSGNIDLTAALFVDWTVSTSAGSTTNSFTQQLGKVDPQVGATVSSVAVNSGTANTGAVNLTNIFVRNAANTVSTGDQDLSAASTLEVPVSAGATAGAAGRIAYDSTNLFTHVRTSGADSTVGTVLATSTFSETQTCAASSAATQNYTATVTIPANAITQLGDKLRVFADFTLTTPATNQANTGFDLRIDGVQAYTLFQAPNTSGASITGVPYTAIWEIFPTVVSAGANSTVDIYFSAGMQGTGVTGTRLLNGTAATASINLGNTHTIGIGMECTSATGTTTAAKLWAIKVVRQ